MHLVKKRVFAGAVTSCSGSEDLPAVVCESTGTAFVLDTGAAISLLPRSFSTSSRLSSSPSMVAEMADKSEMPLYGSCFYKFKLSAVAYVHRFYVGDVSAPILGTDFLRTYKLAVHPDEPFLRPSGGVAPLLSNKHCPPSTSFTVPTPKAAGSRPKVNRISVIMREFADVFSADFSRTTPTHGVEHEIHTTGGPFACRPRRLAPDKLAAVKEEFLKMEEMGIVRRSKSPWGSPLHVVEKKGGGLRPCGDYRLLNQHTKKDRSHK